jgi:8-oxo-dGTP pyrophosphatase MutT (NUDIX family)
MYCGCIDAKLKYKRVRKDGIVAVIIHSRKVLLLKRRNIPVILNPGIWTFLSGGRSRGERYLDTAYREIKEETGIGRDSLRLLFSTMMTIFDRKRRLSWPNRVFIFVSSTGKVRLDYENSRYRWAAMDQIEKEINYTNIFINRSRIEKMIRGFIHGEEGT